MQFMSQLNLTSMPEFGLHSALNATQPQRAQYEYNIDNSGYYDSGLTARTSTLRPENALCNNMDTTATQEPVVHSVQKTLMAPPFQCATNFHEFVTPRRNEQPLPSLQNDNAPRRLSRNENQTYTPVIKEKYRNNTQTVYQVRNNTTNRQFNDALPFPKTWDKQLFSKTTNIPHETNVGANSHQVRQTLKRNLSGSSSNACNLNTVNLNSFDTSYDNYGSNNTARTNIFNHNSNNSLQPAAQSFHRNFQTSNLQYQYPNKNAGYKSNNAAPPVIISASNNKQFSSVINFGFNSEMQKHRNSNVDPWSRQRSLNYSKEISPESSRFPFPTQSASSFFPKNHESCHPNMFTQSTFEGFLPHNASQVKATAQPDATQAVLIRSATNCFSSHRGPDPKKFFQRKINVTSNVSSSHVTSVPSQSAVNFFSNYDKPVCNNSSSKGRRPLPGKFFRKRNIMPTTSAHVSHSVSHQEMNASLDVPYLKRTTESTTNYFGDYSRHVPLNISRLDIDQKSKDSLTRNTTESPALHDVLNQENKLDPVPTSSVEQATDVPLLMDPSNITFAGNVHTACRGGAVTSDLSILQNTQLPEWTQGGDPFDLKGHTKMSINDNGIYSGKDDFGNSGFINDRQSTSSNDSGFQGDVVSPNKLNISRKIKRGAEFDQSSLSLDSYSTQELIEKMETVKKLFDHLKASYVKKCLIQTINDSKDQFKNELNQHLRSKLTTFMEKVMQIDKLERCLENSKTADSNVAITDDPVFSKIVAENRRVPGESSLFKAGLVEVENESKKHRAKVKHPVDKTSPNIELKTLDSTAQFETDPFVMQSALTAMKDIGIDTSCFSAASEFGTTENVFTSNKAKQFDDEQPSYKSTIMKGSQINYIGNNTPGLENKIERTVEISNSTLHEQHKNSNIRETFAKVRLQSLEEWYSDISDTEDGEITHLRVQSSEENKNLDLDKPNLNVSNNCKDTISESEDDIIFLSDSTQPSKEKVIRNSSGFTTPNENCFGKNETRASVTVRENIMGTPVLALNNNHLQQFESNVKPKLPALKSCVEKSTSTSDLETKDITINATKSLNKIVLKKVKNKSLNESNTPHTPTNENYNEDENKADAEHWVISTKSSKINTTEESEGKIWTPTNFNETDIFANGNGFDSSEADDHTILNTSEAVDHTSLEDKTALACERKLSSESNSSYLSILSIREEESLETENKEIEEGVGLPVRQSTPELFGDEFIADTCLLSDDENMDFDDVYSENNTLGSPDGFSIRAPTLQDTINRLEKRVMYKTAVSKDICNATGCFSKSCSSSLKFVSTTDSQVPYGGVEHERSYRTKRKISLQNFTDDESSDEEFNFAKRSKTNLFIRNSKFYRDDRLKRRASPMAQQPIFPVVTTLPHMPIPYHKKSTNSRPSTQNFYYSAMWSLVSMGALSTYEKI